MLPLCLDAETALQTTFGMKVRGHSMINDLKKSAEK